LKRPGVLPRLAPWGILPEEPKMVSQFISRRIGEMIRNRFSIAFPAAGKYEKLDYTHPIYRSKTYPQLPLFLDTGLRLEASATGPTTIFAINPGGATLSRTPLKSSYFFRKNCQPKRNYQLLDADNPNVSKFLSSLFIVLHSL